MQGLPLFPDSLEVMSLKHSPFNPDVITPSAQRRLAGNSFNQACMTAFMAFVLGSLRKRSSDSAPPTSSRVESEETQSDDGDIEDVD